jgi:hypothetical protein
MTHHRFLLWPVISAAMFAFSRAVDYVWRPILATVAWLCDEAFPAAFAALGERLALAGDSGSAGLTLSRVRSFRDTFLQRTLSRRRSAPLNVGSVGAGLCFGC